MAHSHKENALEELLICLPGDVLDSLKEISQSTNTDIQELIQNYIHEGILQAQPKQKQRNFIKHSQESLEAHNVADVDSENIAEKFTYKYL